VEGLKGAGFALNEELQKTYGDYLAAAQAKRPDPAIHASGPISEMTVDPALVARMATGADVA